MLRWKGIYNIMNTMCMIIIINIYFKLRATRQAQYKNYINYYLKWGSNVETHNPSIFSFWKLRSFTGGDGSRPGRGVCLIH